MSPPPGHRPRETWGEVLSRLELDLDVLESADPTTLAAAAAAAPPFEPPAGLGPLPVALQERALGLQLRLAAAEQRVERTMEEVRRSLVVTNRMDQRSTEPAFPRFFDAAL